jgi:hypothetical protein
VTDEQIFDTLLSAKYTVYCVMKAKFWVINDKEMSFTVEHELHRFNMDASVKRQEKV